MDHQPQGIDNVDFSFGDNFHSTDTGFEILTLNHPQPPKQHEILSVVPPEEHDSDDINVISIDPKDIKTLSYTDYLDLSVKAVAILAGCFTHPYIAYSTAFATASTALVAYGSNYFNSEDYDFWAKTFLKIQNGSLKHIALMGVLRDASYGVNDLNKEGVKQEPSSLCKALIDIGFGDWNEKKNTTFTKFGHELAVHIFSNLFTSLLGEGLADLSNKLILEPITKGKLEMEHEDFWSYRAPMTAFKRVIKFSIDKYFKVNEKAFENWWSNGDPDYDDNAIPKPFSVLNHFGANLPIAVHYNELSKFIVARTLSHSVAKYAAEWLSYIGFKNLFGTHDFFKNYTSLKHDYNYTLTDTDFTKIISIIFGSAGYTLSKDLWDYIPKKLWGASQ